MDDFFERDDFDLITHFDHDTLFNRKYNMYWTHLFDSLAGDALNLKKVNLPFNDETVELLYPIIKKQKDSLRERFIAAKNHATLYVISHPYEGPSLETLLRVRDALVQIRKGNRQFFLLFVPGTKTYEGIENIAVREDRYLVPYEWNGSDPARWKEILDEFNFIPGIWD